MEGAIRRVPAMADAGVNRVINGPEGVHAGQRVHPRRVGGPRVLRRRRVLGPRHRRARAASVARSRRGSSTASPSSTSGRWTSGGSGRPTAVAGATRWRARSRTTRPTTTSTTRTRSASPAARCGCRRPTRSSTALGAVVRREVRLGAPELVRVERAPPATRRSDRAAGRASTGRPRSAPRRWRRGGRPACSTRPRSPRSRSSGRARSRSSSGCARNDIDVPVGRDRLHAAAQPPRRHRVRPHGHPGHGRPLPARHRHGVRATTTWRGCGGTCPDDGSVLLNDITSGRVCFGLWGPRARDILGVGHARRPLRRRLPVPHRARHHRRLRAGLRAARHLRRASSAGSCTPTTEYGRRAVADAVGGRAGRTAWSPAATGRSMRSGSRRATASGRATSPRTRRRTKPGSGSRSRWTRARVHRPRGARRGQGGRAAQAAALPRPRRSALGLPRQRAGPASAATIVGRVTSGGYGFAVERSIAYAYLPPDRRPSGRAARSRSSASGSASRSPASRCTTPTARGSARERRGRPAPARTTPSCGWLAFALACCDEADALALEHFRRDLVIETKPDRTFVTQADTAIERPIRERIADAYPGPRPRRRGIRHRGRRRGTVRWYIDPIDGTHNFMRGVPLFGTLLAVERGRRAGRRRHERAGARRALVRAARRRGVGGRRARAAAGRRAGSRVSGVGGARRRPDPVRARRSRSRRAAGARASTRSSASAWRDRGFGDFWGYALVAEGAAEAMIEVGPNSWDLAAPSVVVEEAGGRMTDFARRAVDPQRDAPRDERHPAR